MTIVRIDRRFRGPPNSGNGGYFAGLLARELGGSDVVATLLRPAPLDAELIVEVAGNMAEMRDGDTVIASAVRSPVAPNPPAPPTLDEARTAEALFNPSQHIYPGCFVCGPERRADGLAIFPGASGTGKVAAVWTPWAELADADGHVRPEFVWAALDCPGYFAVQDAAGLALLGRIGVRVEAPVPAGEPLVVTGWAIASEGRKHRAGTALFAASGTRLAVAEQLWVTLR